MGRQEIIDRLSVERTTLAQLGVASLKLFGSLARDEGGPDSDADFVVSFSAPATFDRFMDVKAAS